jgi:hypothetical protein
MPACNATVARAELVAKDTWLWAKIVLVIYASLGEGRQVRIGGQKADTESQKFGFPEAVRRKTQASARA